MVEISLSGSENLTLRFVSVLCLYSLLSRVIPFRIYLYLIQTENDQINLRVYAIILESLTYLKNYLRVIDTLLGESALSKLFPSF